MVKLETHYRLAIIMAVAIASFVIGAITRPIPEVEQKSMTAADSLFEVQWAEYEVYVAQDPHICTFKDGRSCKHVPTLGGFIDWKIANNKHKDSLSVGKSKGVSLKHMPGVPNPTSTMWPNNPMNPNNVYKPIMKP